MRAWLAALRIARREARRAKGRSILVVALIGLPVFGLAFAAASYDSFRLTPGEEANRLMGTTDAVVIWPYRVPVLQNPTEHFVYQPRDPSARPPDGDAAGPWRPTGDDLLAALPPGSRVIPDRHGTLNFRTAAGKGNLQVRELDYTDPLARGILVPLQGRAPAGAGEVAISPYAAKRIGAGIGGTLTTGDGSHSWRIVGLVEDPQALRLQFAVFRPGTLVGSGASPQFAEAPDERRRWLVDTPAPLSWPDVRGLNQRGLAAMSRAVLQNPPPDSENELAQRHPVVKPPVFAFGTLLGGILVLEVVLLAGPAFAVGARRRRRELALVAAAGGTPGHLRRIVLADGVTLGALAAAVGVGLGVLAAAAASPLVEEYVAQSRPGAFRVFPVALAGLAAIAVGSGVLAALVPAWLAARQPVVAALSGRYAATRLRRRWAIAGVVGMAIGAAIAMYGGRRVSAELTMAGLIVGELGLVLCTPAIVGAIARLGGWLPLAARIALRDIGRNRAAAAPAISAVLAAVAVSGVLATTMVSEAAGERAAREADPLPDGYAVALSEGFGKPPPPPEAFRAMETALRKSLPATDVVTVGTVACASGTKGTCILQPQLPAARKCPFIGRASPQPLTAADKRAARRDGRCDKIAEFLPMTGHLLSSVVVDPDALGRIVQLDPATLARATETLRAGGAVATDARYVVDGQVRITIRNYPAAPDQQPGTGGTGSPADPPAHPQAAERQASLAAVALPAGSRAPGLLLGPGALARLGLGSQPLGLVAATSRIPTQAAEDRLHAAREGIPGGWSVDVLRPYGQETDLTMLILAIGAGLITLGAAAIATGLAATDSRADLATLGAIGATPGVRRLLSLSQTGLIAGLGSVLGVLAGVGASAAVIIGMNQAAADEWPAPATPIFTMPWPNVAASLLVVPLIAMLGAGLLTRSRLPIERRM